MTNQPVKIKPGILVATSVRCTGGVSYQKQDLSDKTEDRTSVSTWETTRVISDVVEHERSTKIRTTIRNAIARECYHTPFGLLCTSENEAKVDAAISEGRALAEKFNATAQTVRIDVYVLKGRVATSDQEAASAIAAEVHALLGELERACKAADVETIRKTAIKARDIGKLLDGQTGTDVSEAIETARKVARAVVKRVEKDGENAAQVLSEISLTPILSARFTLGQALALGLDEASEAAGNEGTNPLAPLPGVDLRRFSGLDMQDQAPADVAAVAKPPTAAPVPDLSAWDGFEDDVTVVPTSPARGPARPALALPDLEEEESNGSPADAADLSEGW